MKIRNIPFGYCYQNGTVTVHPSESLILNQIFDSYLHGLSLLKIAENLNAEKIEYVPGVIGWNKARLMRIIDDARYLGNDTYPALIGAETYAKLQELKNAKNTQKGVDRTADIFCLNLSVLCPNCGSEMHRRHDSRCKVHQRWTCQNSECKTLIEITDADLLQGVTDALNKAIYHPDIIQTVSEDSEPSSDVSRLNAEIAHTLETYSFNKEALRKKMMECVSLKYRGIHSENYIAKRLKADFEKSSPLSEFSADFCYRTVKSIRLGADKTISLTLINDQQIGKEQAL